MCRHVLPRARHVAVLFALTAAALLAPAASSATAAAPGALLDSTSFEGQTRSGETLLHVQALGRYAVISEGTQGARIDLIDRMAGTVASRGQESGVEASSGRIDAFLEPGDYKVRISKPTAGRVSLSVRTYATVNAGADPWDVPILYDRQTVTGELHDLELLSYWVRLDPSDPTLVVEIEGRSLVDAAVWKDGVWDTGVRPLSRTFEPEQGKPITTLEINSQLDPGLYLVVCVGGPGRPWAGESTQDLFSITRGGRFLGSTGLARVTLGERGIESFLVGAGADVFQVRARNNTGYLIGVAPNTPGSSRYDYRRAARIDPKSDSYRTSISGRTGGSTQWLTVQGPPGETVEVRWFPSLSAIDSNLVAVDPGQDSEPYLVTAIGAADGEESIDLTGLEITMTGDDMSFSIDASGIQSATLGAGAPLHRRINLLARLSFLAQVKTAGSYDLVEAKGSAGARYGFLLLDDWIAGERDATPVVAVAGGRVQLQAKLYIVTLEPTATTAEKSGAGILDFAIAPAGTVRPTDAALPAAPVNALFWPRVDPASDGDRRSILLLGRRGSIPVGGSARSLPLDLEEPEHAAWEKRIDAIRALCAKRRLLRTDELRRNTEDLGPGVYDKLSYHERRCAAIANTLLQKNVFTVDALGRKMSEIERRWTTGEVP